MRWPGWFKSSHKKSYAQCGEDLNLDFFFQQIGISKPSYLDVGAHHPTYLSNTYLFYLRGARGVCVEPDPRLLKKIRRVRKGDICLGVGVGDGKLASGELLVMSTPTLNTFSAHEAGLYSVHKGYGDQKIDSTLQVELVTLNTLAGKYFSPWPNLISIDIEGLDLAALKAFDFKKFRTEAFCVETLRFRKDGSFAKIAAINRLFSAQGYQLYADTFINSIYIRKNLIRFAG